VVRDAQADVTNSLATESAVGALDGGQEAVGVLPVVPRGDSASV